MHNSRIGYARPQRLVALLLLSLMSSITAAQQRIDWNAPFPPHRIIGNVYYVGTAQLATFLITTPDGHFLINSDFESTVPVIQAAVEALGFSFEDIAIVLGSHAHGDHMEGDALIKELTGAEVMAMAEDVPLLENMRPGGKPHPIDRVLRDGEQITLGGTTLTANRTGGHTPGCTTWTLTVPEGGQDHNVLILCSVGVNPGYVLVGNEDYPNIAADYERSFARLRGIPVDVFLGAHGSFYGLDGKYPKLAEGGANPFVDRAGFIAHLDMQEARFREVLAEQRRAAE